MIIARLVLTIGVSFGSVEQLCGQTDPTNAGAPINPLQARHQREETLVGKAKYDAAVDAALQEMIKSVAAAQRVYLTELDAAIRQAMAEGSLERANRYDAERKPIAAELAVIEEKWRQDAQRAARESILLLDVDEAKAALVTSVVYVCDATFPMLGYEFDVLKKGVRQSIDSLPPSTKFNIIFFRGGNTPEEMSILLCLNPNFESRL